MRWCSARSAKKNNESLVGAMEVIACAAIIAASLSGRSQSTTSTTHVHMDQPAAGGRFERDGRHHLYGTPSINHRDRIRTCVSVCMVSAELDVSSIHLGRVLYALASSSAISSCPVASAEKWILETYEG